jgi:uncharacterized DUF497 family protein
MDDITFNWSEEKNKILKKERGISFEEVVCAIENGDLLEIIPNSSKNHKDQKCFIVRINGYPCKVPYVEDENEIFLKTIHQDRKQKKLLNK